MKNTKKFLLSRELHETVVVRSRVTTRVFCGTCKAECDFLTLDSAVELTGFGTREILACIDAGEIHAADAPNGQMLICARSLAR